MGDAKAGLVTVAEKCPFSTIAPFSMTEVYPSTRGKNLAATESHSVTATAAPPERVADINRVGVSDMRYVRVELPSFSFRCGRDALVARRYIFSSGVTISREHLFDEGVKSQKPKKKNPNYDAN